MAPAITGRTEEMSMSKFIVDNRSTWLDDSEALRCVADVVDKGRVSNNGKQYCYGTLLKGSSGEEAMIWTDVNKSSDRFVIVDG